MTECIAGCDCEAGECRLAGAFALGVQVGLNVPGPDDPHRAEDGD